MSNISQDTQTQEWFFPQHSYILSETDEKGFILYANDLFCEMAGYHRDELIGQPHNIVRHPDMPRIAFEGLWNDIQSKGFWTGIVKNLRKDGGHYWVYATALRKIDSNGKITYLSIREVPSRADVTACTALYSDLKSKE